EPAAGPPAEGARPEEPVRPIGGVDGGEERARSVARVGDVHLAARELPGEPGVHGAECELAALGAFAQARAVVEQPRELGAREIGIEEEAGLAGEERLEATLSQLVTSRRCA